MVYIYISDKISVAVRRAIFDKRVCSGFAILCSVFNIYIQSIKVATEIIYIKLRKSHVAGTVLDDNQG